MNITQFSIEEVRCFAERQNFEIRPLTFLVGENSTGKTTALACFQVLADYLDLEIRSIDFNRKPYSLGIFRDIVRNTNNEGKAFKLGFTLNFGNENVEWLLKFVEKQGAFEPAVKSVTLTFKDGKIVAQEEDGLQSDVYLASFNEIENHYHLIYDSDWLSDLPPFYYLHFGLEEQSEGEKAFKNYLRAKKESIGKGESLRWFSLSDTSVLSTSPIRSEPHRTYDPTRVFNDPEGSNVPMYLMQLQATQPERWKSLKDELIRFGQQSGMFHDIDIQTFGLSGGPFQLKFEVRGQNSNLVDVGYGVSQILPILVQTLDPPIARPSRSIERHFLLMQQPEVHLHPRAQAALSSLLATSAHENRRSFLIETHSDYMIDRARIEIRKGTIRPEDVSLIYLEPKGRTVKVHNISFDGTGDMISIPDSYREFFMKETVRLMGFED